MYPQEFGDLGNGHPLIHELLHFFVFVLDDGVAHTPKGLASTADRAGRGRYEKGAPVH